MERQLTLIPHASIHPGQINLYHEVQWEPSRPVKYDSSENELNNSIKYEHLLTSTRSAEGHVSEIAKRKLKKALNYFLFISSEKTIHLNYSGRKFKFKLAFVTLTLPSTQVHSDNEIKSKCLNSFLIELKKFYKVHNYIWRAEKQKNGNIHFHLLVDKFIPYQELRDRWNRIINKLGYVDRYRENQINFFKDGFRVRSELLPTWPKDKQLQAYKRGSKLHWNSPNSTDIHSIRNIQNIKVYISKYLTKQELSNSAAQEQAEKVISQGGRIWGCNYELSNITGAQTILDSELKDELDRLADDPNVKIISEQYYTIFIFDFKLFDQYKCQRLFQLFANYIFETFNYSIQLNFDSQTF